MGDQSIQPVVRVRSLSCSNKPMRYVFSLFKKGSSATFWPWFPLLSDPRETHFLAQQDVWEGPSGPPCGGCA